MNKIISTGLVLGAALSLVGCGGGSSDPESVTKVLFDGPVVGVDYTCSSSAPEERKKTNAQGEFTCLAGDTATFYIGSYELGSATVEDDGQSLLVIDEIADGDAATDLKQLLQTLDSDPEDDVIVIPDDAAEQLAEVDVTPGDPAFDDAMAEAIGEPLVDEATAIANAANDLAEAKIKELFAGKTFYVVEEGDDDVETVVFDATLEHMTVTEEEGTFTGDLRLEGDRLYCCDNEYDTIASVKADYILVNSYINGVLDEQMRFYTDESKAAEYAESNADSPLKAVLAGKTFYIVSHDGMTKVVFDTDFTTVITTDYDHDGTPESTSDVDDVVTDGDKLIINSDGDYLKFNSSQEEYQLWDLYDSHNTLEEQVRAYADETKAKEYLATLSGGESVDAGITEAMLEGKVFYMKYTGETNVEYIKAEFKDSNYIGRKLSIDENGTVIDDETGSFPYTIIDGKVRVDIADDNNYIWFELTSQSDTQWNLQLQIDEGKDGTIEVTMGDTWYLYKPSDFPDEL